MKIDKGCYMWILRIALSLSICVAMVTKAHSMDQIRLALDICLDNPREAYAYTLLENALKATIDSDGSYRITNSSYKMSRERALHELILGDSINVHVAATRAKWEVETLPVRIPIRKGVLGYRLLLVHKSKDFIFKDIQKIEQLKRLTAGLGQQWTTTAVLRKAGFYVETGVDYEGLFGMLNRGRFDYFPRGLNEIFREFDEYKDKYPDLRIESALALYFPTPSYFFVSPRYPELADRIRRGMEKLIATGELDRMFEAEFGSSIKKAKLDQRMLFSIENPLLTPETPFDRPELWFFHE
ncbi:transporter substrate-binding domain-containing protein [Pseudodesulfovibrio sp. zrk46]|uniref:substrate-binding periplasmic protein n=1 Tax=Pseudodesulfovibrio sp. zrk46 TaxID=2725288 RepID=UPI0014490E1B|nr:transporter substrate-binding domain-containing protein [Pseudodesulfovibrio sp. zrk46]QJB57161.1 amino acid ABC transporter substrate-binding protein [Pseudodesulfovibrio sp. zrk46]